MEMKSMGTEMELEMEMKMELEMELEMQMRSGRYTTPAMLAMKR